jgi:uncharacterized protein YbjT (DUF2867 family)
MTRQPVLVTGATGDTGGYAIDALRKLDVPVGSTMWRKGTWTPAMNTGAACARCSRRR